MISILLTAWTTAPGVPSQCASGQGKFQVIFSPEGWQMEGRQQLFCNVHTSSPILFSYTLN